MVISENSTDKKPEKKEKPSTKVIIRRLPPSIDQETFLTQVSPVPDYNYIYVVKADLSLGENAFSRVYINFVYPDDVYSFKERFDNYVFLDNRTGHEYPAVVEFAPFQKIPKKRGKRVDPKCGSIETDPIYLDFVESLNKPEQQDEKPEYTLQLNSEDKADKNDITTPLLEFIKNKRAQKLKIREMRREERERKLREYETRKKEYPRGYDVRKYDEKSPVKSFKSHVSKVASPKTQDKHETVDNNKNKTEKSDNNNSTSTNKVDSNSNFSNSKLDNKPTGSGGGYGGKSRDRKYDDRDNKDRGTKKDIKPRFPKKDYDHDNSSISKRSGDSYGGNKKSFEDVKNKNKEENASSASTKIETKPGYNQKRVKKYSERREERKIEAQKAEQRKLEQAKEKDSSQNVSIKECTLTETQNKDEQEPKVAENLAENSDSKERRTAEDSKAVVEDKNSNKIELTKKVPLESKEAANTIEENMDVDLASGDGKSLQSKESGEGGSRESETARRIRNKDRPTIAIYRPGMLSKRKQNEDESKG